jgi:hypothetical protein
MELDEKVKLSKMLTQIERHIQEVNEICAYLKDKYELYEVNIN